MQGFSHLRRRARRSKRFEPFPSPIPWKRALDYVMYAVAFLAPIALVPQIIDVYGPQGAQGVSAVTWGVFTVLNGLWALYGIVHKDRQLFFSSGLISLFDLVIFVGVLTH